MELYNKSASELSKMLRAKEVSAVEIADSVYKRIENVDDKVGAYLETNYEKAIKMAKKADEMIAEGKGTVMTGIPVAVKDNICVKGYKATCASKMLENFEPPYNAFVTENLIKAGAVITGKVNMDEFAMGSSTENSALKRTANPHDLSRVPGGSSGGSAAAVAAREAIVSLGSDTGGSIRQPASFCGVVGLKPTYSSVSRYGLVAFASSLDQIGPIGKTVADTAALYSVIAGKDSMDSTSLEANFNLSLASGGSLSGVKIGIPKQYFGDGVSAKVKELVMNAAKTLESAGATLVNVDLPGTDYALSAYYIISCAEASSNLSRYDGVKYGYRAENPKSLEELFVRSRSEGFGDEVKRRIMLGTFVLSSGYYDAYYKKAKLFQQKLKEEFKTAFRSCDMLLTPTSPDVAFRIGEIEDPLKMYASDICTVTVNLAGLPAVSVPVEGTKDNMPVGMQLIGKPFADAEILRVAGIYEDLIGGFKTQVKF